MIKGSFLGQERYFYLLSFFPVHPAPCVAGIAGSEAETDPLSVNVKNCMVILSLCPFALME
jgi:hypothetical protein